MKKSFLHIYILLGLVLGVLFAFFSAKLGLPHTFTINYIKPFGVIFLNALKMIAVPIIFISTTLGIASIENTKKLSKLGGKTLLLFVATTLIAVTIGMVLVAIVKPGKVLSQKTREKLISLYTEKNKNSVISEKIVNKAGPLQYVVNLVPENLISAMSNNNNSIQVILISFIIGIAILSTSIKTVSSVVASFKVANEIMMVIVHMIMKFAPIGVFALVASLMVEIVGLNDLEQMVEVFYALAWYIITTVLGLAIMIFMVYPVILKMFTSLELKRFFKVIFPAQLVAFTTSSSTASLPITMECVEKHLGVSEKISSFVLPLATTLKHDGTALYQGIAIAFIIQSMGLDLSLTTQIGIMINIILSSIGVAGVPCGAVVTIAMILQAYGIPEAGLALIMIPERLLDMCRTVTNITGDAVVTVAVASMEKTEPN